MTDQDNSSPNAGVPEPAKGSAKTTAARHASATQDAGPELPSLLSTKDVCGRFNRSSRTIRSWCRVGKLDPVRVGGAVFFRSTDIARMILGNPLRQ